MLRTKSTARPTENAFGNLSPSLPPHRRLTDIDRTAPIPRFLYPLRCLPLNRTLSPRFSLKNSPPPPEIVYERYGIGFTAMSAQLIIV